MSRTVNGEFLFGEVEKEMLRRHIWLVAEFCGLVVMTYAVMSNHFHLVACVPKMEAISDAELLRRYRLLHSDISPWLAMRLEAIERMMAENGEEAQEWRERQLALMGTAMNEPPRGDRHCLILPKRCLSRMALS